MTPPNPRSDSASTGRMASVAMHSSTEKGRIRASSRKNAHYPRKDSSQAGRGCIDRRNFIAKDAASIERGSLRKRRLPCVTFFPMLRQIKPLQLVLFRNTHAHHQIDHL